MQPQGFEILGGGIPKNLIVDPVVTMSEDIPHANDLRAGGDVLEHCRGDIADSEKRFSNDFEFPFKNQLKGAIGKEFLKRSAFYESLDLLDCGQDVMADGRDLMQHKARSWLNPLPA